MGLPPHSVECFSLTLMTYPDFLECEKTSKFRHSFVKEVNLQTCTASFALAVAISSEAIGFNGSGWHFAALLANAPIAVLAKSGIRNSWTILLKLFEIILLQMIIFDDGLELGGVFLIGCRMSTL